MSVIVSSGKDGVPVSCFLESIPEWIEAALEKRYASLHSSLPFIRIYRSLENLCCYVTAPEGGLPEILLFLRRHRRIEVLNEMLQLSAEETARFIEFAFGQFPEADLVSFSAVDTSVDLLKYPVQRYHSKHTFVISLPDTPDAYLAAIGKTTRASIRQQSNTVHRVFPSFTYRCLVKDQIDADTLRAIVKCSEHRINAGGARIRHDIDRISALAKECGFVVVLLIDGRMCAGSINYQVGSAFFGDVTCYDPQYQKYGLGKLCTFRTVCESILRGGRQFYLGGGEFGFKERMLGKRVDMDQLQVYRSHARMLANVRWAAFAFARGKLRSYQAKLMARKDSLQSRVMLGLHQAYRNRMAK
jgi:hypothetical protein